MSTPPSATRRRTVQAAAALALPSLARSQSRPVRIGYAIARTGPWAGGAQVSQEPNYVLWAEQQNAAGGTGRERRAAAHRTDQLR